MFGLPVGYRSYKVADLENDDDEIDVLECCCLQCHLSQMTPGEEFEIQQKLTGARFRGARTGNHGDFTGTPTRGVTLSFHIELDDAHQAGGDALPTEHEAVAAVESLLRANGR